MAGGHASVNGRPGDNPWHPNGKPRTHLVGVGGSGMRALASVLVHNGWQLSGSDLDLAPVSHLAASGLRLLEGHAAANLPEDAQLLVYSDAIGRRNPELRRAARLGIPALSYFEMIGRLTGSQETLAVAGTHGKSTTTAMAAEIFTRSGRDPTVFCGATPVGQASGGRAGRSDLALVEACEYKANFLHLRPRQAVILGIEPDHFDCYQSFDDLRQAFVRFARSVPPDGLLLARHDCPATRRVTTNLACPVETFGADDRADWSACDLRSQRGRFRFEIRHFGRPLCEVCLQVPGRHNVLNALAAAALARTGGVPSGKIASALGRFRGLYRRLEQLGTFGGVVLVDDYAHHPTEVAAALETVRLMLPGRKTWCVFQPHQASRTEHLLDELAASLQNADRVVVAEVFRARESSPQPGEVTAADLARQVRARGTAVPLCHTHEEIVELLETELAPGDVLITMGAGDIRRICHAHIARIRENRAVA